MNIFNTVVTVCASVNIQGPAGGQQHEPPLWATYDIFG